MFYFLDRGFRRDECTSIQRSLRGHQLLTSGGKQLVGIGARFPQDFFGSQTQLTPDLLSRLRRSLFAGSQLRHRLVAGRLIQFDAATCAHHQILQLLRKLFERLANILMNHVLQQLLGPFTQLPQEVVDPIDLASFVGKCLCIVPQRRQGILAELRQHLDQSLRLFALPLCLGQRNIHGCQRIPYPGAFRLIVSRLNRGNEFFCQRGQVEVAVLFGIDLQLFTEFREFVDPAFHRIHRGRQRSPTLIQSVQRPDRPFVPSLVLAEQLVVGHLKRLVVGHITQQLFRVGWRFIGQHRDAFLGRELERILIE